MVTRHVPRAATPTGALEHPKQFWLEAAARRSPWSRLPARSRPSTPGRAPLYGWFPDGILNKADNALTATWRRAGASKTP